MSDRMRPDPSGLSAARAHCLVTWSTISARTPGTAKRIHFAAWTVGFSGSMGTTVSITDAPAAMSDSRQSDRAGDAGPAVATVSVGVLGQVLLVVVLGI